MTTDVSISVVIPLYNKAGYVEAAIQSVLAQQYPALEVLVIDDGSTDDGPARVRAMQAPGVTLLTQANAGVSAARNRGIALAQGDLVAFLDADDVHHPGYLAALAQLWQRYPQAGMFCTGYRRVDAKGPRDAMLLPGMAPGASGLITDFHGQWSRASFTCTISIAVSRSLLQRQAPAFAVGERLGEDQDLWFRLAEQSPVAYCNRALADYRIEVAASATQTHAVQGVLPCYSRLAQRLDAGQVPGPLRAGARRLVASHLINLARARAAAGDAPAAAALLYRRHALGNPVYWARSAVRLLATRVGLAKW